MQSAMYRPAVRAVSQQGRALQSTGRRSYASDTNATSHSSKVPIFLVGGVVIAAVAGRYILHSDKPAASGQAEIKAIRNEKGTHDERRDPRDSGVKTLEQKKQKEAAASSS